MLVRDAIDAQTDVRCGCRLARTLAPFLLPLVQNQPAFHRIAFRNRPQAKVLRPQARSPVISAATGCQVDDSRFLPGADIGRACRVEDRRPTKCHPSSLTFLNHGFWNPLSEAIMGRQPDGMMCSFSRIRY